METVPLTAQTDAKIEPEKKAEISITVKQPKVEKPPKEKKELTEGQKRALEKMKEALAKKRQEKIDIKKANEDDERKKREDAVKKAEEEAKKITENVKVEKVRGRKVGTKAPQAKIVRNIPEPVQERQMTQQEYTIQLLRQRGVNVPDNATPYHLKMLLSRFR